MTINPITIFYSVLLFMLSTLLLLFMDQAIIYGEGIHTAANRIAFDSTHDRMYITQTEISVIDTKNNTVIDEISIGKNRPNGIAFDSTHDRMYVPIYDNRSILVIDTKNNTVIDEISFDNFHFKIDFDSNNDRLYLANRNGISVIDTKNNTVIDEISIDSRPIEIAFDSINDRIYVTNTNYSISVIDTKNNTVIDEIPVYGGNPLGIAFDSTHERMYVAKLASTISVIDTKNNTVIDEIPHSDHSRMVFDPLHNRIYITGFFNNTLSALDVKNNTITDKISIDSTMPWNIAFDSKHNRVYVGDSSLYSVVDTNNNRVIKTIKIN